MSRTRFSVLQSTAVVVLELNMVSFQRAVRGNQFAMSLDVSTDGFGFLAFDIYVDRLAEGYKPEEVVDGSKRYELTASIEPDGPRYKVEMTIEQAKDLYRSHSEVRLPLAIHEALRKQRDARAVEKLLGDAPLHE